MRGLIFRLQGLEYERRALHSCDVTRLIIQLIKLQLSDNKRHTFFNYKISISSNSEFNNDGDYGTGCYYFHSPYVFIWYDCDLAIGYLHHDD